MVLLLRLRCFRHSKILLHQTTSGRDKPCPLHKVAYLQTRTVPENLCRRLTRVTRIPSYAATNMPYIHYRASLSKNEAKNISAVSPISTDRDQIGCSHSLIIIWVSPFSNDPVSAQFSLPERWQSSHKQSWPVNRCVVWLCNHKFDLISDQIALQSVQLR